jgi:hypothetical protein
LMKLNPWKKISWSLGMILFLSHKSISIDLLSTLMLKSFKFINLLLWREILCLNCASENLILLA